MCRGTGNTLLVNEGVLFLRGAVAVPLSSEVKATGRIEMTAWHGSREMWKVGIASPSDHGILIQATLPH